MNRYDLKTFLEKLYTDYKHKFSSDDPVWILHSFSDICDIETAGLITSCYTYGSVKGINNFLSKLFNKISRKPYEFTINFSKRKDKKYLQGLNYRFIRDFELIEFFNEMKKLLLKHSSLENIFFSNYQKHRKVENAIRDFISEFNFSGKTFLFPKVKGSSAFKRVNLFLRWMVRKDEIDMGIWKRINSSELIMPVDVHVARVSKKLGLVKRRTIDLKFAVELTENLRKFDPTDPVKYDFALCHAAMEGRIHGKI
ncbi:MAG: TIGR02757 family protein [Ignavibacteria bacterium]|nr:TIGR02757 family protein [Ignavibacteria bacterium]